MAVSACVPVPVDVTVQAATSSDPAVASRTLSTAKPGYLFPLDDPPTPKPLVLLKRGEGAKVVPAPGWYTVRGVAVTFSGNVPEGLSALGGLEAFAESSGGNVLFGLGRLEIYSQVVSGSRYFGVRGLPDGAFVYVYDPGSPFDGPAAETSFSETGPAKVYVDGGGTAEAGYSVTVSGTVMPGRLDYSGTPPWDCLYSPRTGLRKIVYAGDRAVFSAPASGDSLRGEALAYLMSGYKRVADSVYPAGPGLPWIDEDGKVSSVPLFWNLATALSLVPALDLFRLRLLGFMYARRSPVPPLSGPSGGWTPAVFLEEGHSTSGGVVSQATPDFPGWGTAYFVCASQAALDANGGDWLADGGSYADTYDDLPDDWAAFMLFAALNSPVQPVPCPLEPSPAPSPDPGGRFAEGYVPPSGGDPAEDPPQGLRARDVAALFARPSGDPAAFARAWARELCGNTLQNNIATFWFDARAEREETMHCSAAAADPDYARELAEWEDVYARFLDTGFRIVAYGSGGPGTDPLWSKSVSPEALFRAGPWPAAHPSGGDVVFGGPLFPEQASARVTTTSDSQGAGVASGSSWIVSARSTDVDYYPPFTEWFPHVVNYRNTQSQTGYESTGVPETGLFDVPYASVPPSADRVPVDAPDDVACLPLCTAVVEWTRDDLDDGASAPVPGGGAAERTHAVHGRWRVCVPVPASFSSQGPSGPSFGRWTREAGSSSWTFSGTGANAVPLDAAGGAAASFAALAKVVVDAVRSAYPQDAAAQSLPDPSADPFLMLSGASTYSYSVRPGEYCEVVDGFTGEVMVVDDVPARWPSHDVVYSAKAPGPAAVTYASLSVKMELRHGIFESGYCA